MRPTATVSVDVDPVDLHLLGYGYRDLPPDPLVYCAAVPRLLGALRAAQVRATFFLVGRDADLGADAIAAIAREGHEVASHSLTHPLSFARLPASERRRELVESKQRLEHAAGSEVTGFRSPNFDMDLEALSDLPAVGYRYDASAYPSPALSAARLLLAWKSRSAAALRLGMGPFSMKRDPHECRAGGSLFEFPLSVTPIARLPVYHTMRYVMGDARFGRLLDGFVRRGESLSYSLHAVDALGQVEDRVDRRLARHPGMDRPLAEKLALLERTLVAITARFDTAPFRDRLGGAGGV